MPLRYTLRVVHNDRTIDAYDIDATTPREASLAARVLQKEMRADGREGIVVPTERGAD